MAGHVVPVPAGRLLEWPDGTDVLGADAPAGSRRQTEVAILVVRARAVAGKALFRRRDVVELGVRMRDVERTRIAHRRVGRVHRASYAGTQASARVSVRRRGSAV